MLKGDNGDVKTDAVKIAKLIDHTLLRPDAVEADIVEHCRLAKEYGFGTVCVFPYWLDLAAEELEGAGINLDAPIGFPFGAQSSEVKSFEAYDAMLHRANELDMVINISALRSGNLDYVLEDIECVVAAAVHNDAVVKVILETHYLTDPEKITAARLCERAGAHFVKTSTGLVGGASVEDIKLLRAAVSDEVGIKASGGIRTAAEAIAMISAGAQRIGTSAGPAIIDSLWAKETTDDKTENDIQD